jgi:hypothetical protein
VWQRVAMDSLKFYLGLPCPTLLRPADRPPLKRTYGCFMGGPPTGRAACGRLLPICRPHPVRECEHVVFASFPYVIFMPSCLVDISSFRIRPVIASFYQIVILSCRFFVPLCHSVTLSCLCVPPSFRHFVALLFRAATPHVAIS